MINRIHILGASGSGTSTLAAKLSETLGYEHLDTDDYYWEKTNPPYQNKRDGNDRIKMLKEKFDVTPRWILSGSLCGWGDVLIPYFELVVYLWVPLAIRLARLREREMKRYGSEIESGGLMYQAHADFMDWASKYDTGGMEVRSKKKHEQWLSQLQCKLLRIEGSFDLASTVQRVTNAI